MKYVHVFMVLMVLMSVGLSVTKTVNVQTADGDPYFCNPCRYTYSNSTGSFNGRTPLGADNFTFSGVANEEYTVNVFAQMIGFNISETRTMESGTNSIEANFTRIKTRGAIGFIATTASDFYPTTNNNDGKAYSLQRLENISYSFGYTGFNSYNGGNNYGISDTVSSTGFNAYDTVVLGEIGTPSATISTALTNAENSGVKVVIGAKSLALSNIPISSIVTYDTDTRSGSGGAEYGAVPSASEFPNGYYISHNVYVDVGQIVGNVVGYVYNHFITFGDTTEIEYDFAVRNAGAGSWWSYKTPMFSKYSDWFIVPSSRYVGAVTVEHSPTLKSLMYLMLNDFNTTSPFQNELTLNVYEGTDNCGNVKPVENVLCCISSDCDVSSAISSTQIQYSSAVSPVENPELTARGDATEPVIFWDSQYDYFSTDSYAGVTDVEAWARQYFSLGTDEQRWLVYRDTNLKKSRISFAGSKGSTDGYDHWLLAYDFYDTYMDTALLSDIEFSMDTIDSGNSGKLYYCKGGFPILGSCILQVDTCEAGDYWNMSLYYGINETHFREHGVNCINGVLNRVTTSSLTEIPDFDIPSINWQYGFAPDFIDFQTEIAYNDTIPMKKIQSNRQGGTYNWIRHMVVAKFTPQYVAGTGALTDTGGYIDLDNSTLYYKYTKYSGGNITLYGNGNEQITCTAPSGYAFYNPVTDSYEATYKRNITLETDLTLGVQLQKTRKLRMLIHVTSDTVEDIDNARCSVEGFTDSYSTNGYCYFNNVQPNTEYNITVRTSGAESLTVSMTKYINDYYNSFNSDNSGLFCGNFDGNYTFEVNVDHPTMRFFPYVVTESSSTPVGNAVVSIDGLSCRTLSGTGSCNVDVPIIQGMPYNITVTKSPQIIPYQEDVYMSEMDCDKNYVCSYFLYVRENASYDGNVNDDSIFGDYLGFQGDLDVFEAITVVMEMMSKPMFLGLLIICCVTVVLGYWLGAIGVVVGLTTAVLLTLSVGLIPTSFAIGYFITLALVVAVFMRSGFIEIGGNFGGGGA